MRRFDVLGLLLALGMCGTTAAFDVAECDGDSTLGNAGILLGWAQPTATAMGSIVIDDLGAANSGISPANINGDWAAAVGTWTGVSGTTLAFPATSSSTVTSSVLQATLGKGDGTRAWMLIQPNTKISGTPGGQGWEHVTGTDACSFLGLTYTVFDLKSRLLLDADIMLNDDGPAPASDPNCLAAGRADFYSRTATAGVPTPGLFDVQGIMAHEIGHFLGSDHSIQAGALMAATAAAGANLNISGDDINLMRFLYPTAASPTPPDRNNTTLTSCNSLTTGGTVTTTAGSSGGGCAAGDPGRGAPGLFALLVGAVLALPFRRRRREEA